MQFYSSDYSGYWKKWLLPKWSLDKVVMDEMALAEMGLDEMAIAHETKQSSKVQSEPTSSCFKIDL